MMMSITLFYPDGIHSNLQSRVRSKIRNNDDGYALDGQYFLTCLYPKGHANPELVERGFLRSRLLLQVRLVSYLLTCADFFKVYCSIFTSPSSSEGFDEENEDGPARKKHKSKRQKNATKSHVASLLNMDGKVTSRSIAYAAVMVRSTFFLEIYDLLVEHSSYSTSLMRRSGSKHITVSASLVSITSLSTTSTRKMMLFQSSALKICSSGGISKCLAHLEYCSRSDLSLQSSFSSPSCCN